MGAKWPIFRLTVGTPQNWAPKMHPQAWDKTGGRRIFLPEIRLAEKFGGPGLQVYEIQAYSCPSLVRTAI